MGQQDRRSNWRLVVATTVLYHIVLLVCTAVSLYMYIDILSRQSEDGKKEDISIRFRAIPDISDNQTLELTMVTSRKMNLTGKTLIDVSCNGPYILHAYACSTGLDGREGRGSLEVRLAGTAAASLSLKGNRAVACEGLHAIVYLRKQQPASLYFSGDQHLKIKNVTLGLQYLLGECQY